MHQFFCILLLLYFTFGLTSYFWDSKIPIDIQDIWPVTWALRHSTRDYLCLVSHLRITSVVATCILLITNIYLANYRLNGSLPIDLANHFSVSPVVAILLITNIYLASQGLSITVFD